LSTSFRSEVLKRQRSEVQDYKENGTITSFENYTWNGAARKTAKQITF
jgi:hypothetical protein